MKMDLNPDAKAALAHNPEASYFLELPDPTLDGQDPRQSYVYEWFMKDSGIPFYVGRGVRNRYKHILWKINKRSGQRIKAIQLEHGIDYRIIADGLTYYESKIIAYARIKELISKGITLEQPLSEWRITC